ncbi:unnamed protein product [Dovyalis caffra]|uniref:non-reducing end alpha-L-arabinofuranosidase n=1 Tax=Dovyalis caffra TaxID=77055 RepID=A0AAV1RWZ6_9ROSI|nr:unnamed protein product [Dovyalis caffra]
MGYFKASCGALLVCFVVVLCSVYQCSAAEVDANQTAKLIINASSGRPIPETLFGIFFEELNHAGAGGRWAELVNNRGFEAGGQTTPSNIAPWSIIGDHSSLIVSTDHSSCFERNKVALRMDNIEQGKTYKVVLFVRSPGPINVSVSLTSSDGLQILAAASIVDSDVSNWTKTEVLLEAKGTNPDSRLQLTTSRKGVIWFDQVSAMPLDTYKGHGFRNELIEMLADIKPQFLRFPVESGYHILHGEVYGSAFLSLATIILQFPILASFIEAFASRLCLCCSPEILSHRWEIFSNHIALGGSFVEGEWLRNAFRWKESVGPWEERPGHFGDVWMYWTDNGLGYFEFLQVEDIIYGYLFLQLSEDLGARPIWVFNNGMSHQDQVDTHTISPFVQVWRFNGNKLSRLVWKKVWHSPVVLLQAHMHVMPVQLFVGVDGCSCSGRVEYRAWEYNEGKEALDGLEFARGDSNSKWGSVRAAVGHPQPFDLKYVAVGNGDCWKKDYRGNYLKFYNAIKSAYPDIKIISNCDGSSYSLDHPADYYDFHAFVSEYAVTGKDAGTGSLLAALAEAGFLIGLEKNSDIVEMASCAPLFVNANDRRESSGATLLDAKLQTDYCTLVASAITWQNSGDGETYLKIKRILQRSCPTHELISRDPLSQLLRSSQRNELTLENVFQIVNFGNDKVNLKVTIDGLGLKSQLSGSTKTVLTSSNVMDENSFTDPKKVVPAQSLLENAEKDMNVILSPYSLTSLDLSNTQSIAVFNEKSTTKKRRAIKQVMHGRPMLTKQKGRGNIGLVSERVRRWVVAGPLATSKLIINASSGRHIPETLFGIFFEELNHAGAGGIWAELVNNRGFEAGGQTTPSNIAPWSIIGDQSSLIVSTDRSSCFERNKVALRMDVLCDSNGSNICPAGGVGIYNPGFWGMNIEQGKTYKVVLFVRSPGPINVSVSLTSSDGLQILATANIVDSDVSNWTKTEVLLEAKGTNPNSRLQLTTSRKGVIWFDQVSAMPLDTYKGHGFRNELIEMLADIKPQFLRFPGGCFVEGEWLRNAFRWKESIGPWEERPGHFGDVWMYWTDDGLGYFEFLQLSEDLGARPIWVFNNGTFMPFISGHFLVYPEALDGLEFARGDSDSKWGSVRAAMGHPEPFDLKYVAVGNEDCWKKNYRGNYLKFYDGIKSAYPDIKIISNCDGSSYSLDHPADYYDFHIYATASNLFSMTRQFDRTTRTGPKAFVSEYAVNGEDAGTGSLLAALAEAGFLIGLEKNRRCLGIGKVLMPFPLSVSVGEGDGQIFNENFDVVEMASYAPLLVNANDRSWSPDAIVFNSSMQYGTPSYWAQKFFRESSGATLLDAKLQTNYSKLVASAITWQNSLDGETYLKIKIVNFGNSKVNLKVSIDGLRLNSQLSGSTKTVLTSSNVMDENSFTYPNKVVPAQSLLENPAKDMNKSCDVGILPMVKVGPGSKVDRGSVPLGPH